VTRIAEKTKPSGQVSPRSRDGDAPARATTRTILNHVTEMAQEAGATAIFTYVDALTNPRVPFPESIADKVVYVTRTVRERTEQELVYLTAVYTGLRRSELYALRWGDVRLRATTPYIQLPAEATRAHRADRVPPRGELADALRKVRPANVADGGATHRTMAQSKGPTRAVRGATRAARHAQPNP